MSYAIIRTGGKQFAVEEGQTLRVPSIEKKAGDNIEVETLLSRRRAKMPNSAAQRLFQRRSSDTDAREKIIVFKKKRRKQYKRKQGHRQGYTEIKIEKI